jgi:hypothetical protein
LDGMSQEVADKGVKVEESAEETFDEAENA